jgi:hypothetical protein
MSVVRKHHLGGGPLAIGCCVLRVKGLRTGCTASGPGLSVSPLAGLPVGGLDVESNADLISHIF